MASSAERDLCKRMPTNDIFQTSTGVGHHWRSGYYFPDSKFQSVLREPLPVELCAPSEISPDDHFKTTTGTAHDNKYQVEPYKSDINYRLAPGHYNVHFLKDHKEKLGKGGWRRPLSPSQQKSETHDQFDNKPPLFEPNPFTTIQPFNLQNHHTEGPSKRIAPATENDKLKGRTLYPKDREVLRHLDPYLTTKMKDHRVWDPKELIGYPKKDIATYWNCEDYPKAWGHGLKYNPVPKDAIPRERPPMRDTLKFRSATSVRYIPSKLTPVPHSGLKPLYSDSFQQPSDVKAKEAKLCPVDTPFTLPAPGPRSAFSVPQMYGTEYQNIGRRKKVTV